jgi:hypothetical protein
MERAAQQAEKEAKQQAKDARGLDFDDGTERDNDQAVSEMEEQLKKEEEAYQNMLAAFRGELSKGGSKTKQSEEKA